MSPVKKMGRKVIKERRLKEEKQMGKEGRKRREIKDKKRKKMDV